MLRSPKPSFAVALLFLLILATVPVLADKKSAADQADELSEDASKINLAIPTKQPVKGLHLPIYDLKGALKMQFDARTATRLDDDIVEMGDLRIEIYDDTGRREMLVKFPVAQYDLKASLIKSKESVEIRRTDFVLTGVGMEFDTKKKAGRVFSQIRMEIFERPTDIPTSNDP